MRKISWADELDTGNKTIDGQHRHLVEIVNKYIDAVEKRRDHMVLKNILMELREYTIEHFNSEEEYMESVGYPDIAEHRKEHEDLVRRVKQYQRLVFNSYLIDKNEFIPFLKNWLVNHIINSDHKITKFVNSSH